MLLCPAALDETSLIADVDELVARSRPDGLVLTPPLTDSTALLDHLAELAIPFASISPLRHEGCLGVTMNERACAEQMVQHLISLGHRRIAHIIGHPAHGASSWRLDGYRRGLAGGGLPLAIELEVPGEFSFESGVAAGRKLLDMPNPPTAVFAANDDMAAGVVHLAHTRNIRIPEDLSVCGFDDTPISRQLFPSLTTIHQPTDQMGRLATHALLAFIRRGERTAIHHVAHTLKVRDSTGPVP